MPPELVIFVGLQGAGKSSFFHGRFAATHDHVSMDLMPRSASNRRGRQERLVDEALAAGRSVVVDNTNAAPSERAPLLAIAHARGARVVAYFFDETTDECRARNATRYGRARVPDVAIFTTAKRLVAPSLAEGFDALYRVRVLEGRFEVAPF